MSWTAVWSLHECRVPGVEHDWRKTYDGRRFSVWKCRRCGLQVTDADLEPRKTNLGCTCSAAMLSEGPIAVARATCPVHSSGGSPGAENPDDIPEIETA